MHPREVRRDYTKPTWISTYKEYTVFYESSSTVMISRIWRIKTTPSTPADDSVFPSGEKTTYITDVLCSASSVTHVPSLILHKSTMQSFPAEAMYFPHGEKCAS